MATTRRGFLWVCGATGTGIFLAKTGLIELPRRMVLQMAGRCWFCGKDRREVFGIAGVVGSEARICDECIGLCLDFFDPRSDEIDRLWREELVEKLAQTVRAFLAQPGAVEEIREWSRAHPPIPAPQPPVVREFHCSFCDRSQREVHQLVSGLNGRICEDCAGDAGGLLASSGSDLLVRDRRPRIGAVGPLLRHMTR